MDIKIAFKAKFAIIAPMFNKRLSIYLFIALLVLSGCARATEFVKSVWGSSTKDLEDARVNAIHKTYSCSVTECFDVVLEMTKRPEEKDLTVVPPTQDAAYLVSISPKNPSQNAIMPPSQSTEYLDLFMKNPKKNLIVVMGVPNCVDTTEVGIFFTPVAEGSVKVELSSLSTKAKKIAAEMVFAKLSKRFSGI